MGESKDFRALREQSKQLKERRRSASRNQIAGLRDRGFHIEEREPNLYRICETLDINATRQKYHCLKTGKSGNFRDLDQFVSQYFQIQ